MALMASQVVRIALEVLLTNVCPVPPPLRRPLLRALRTSPCARAVELRRNLALVGALDLDYFFRHICTPAFLVALMDDLRAAGHLSQADAAQAQACILEPVTARGEWQTFTDYLKKERSHE